MLAANCDPDSPAVLPETIATEVNVWGRSQGIEFYVDFETVGNMNDDFAAIPEQNGKPIIFMIGCGHLEEGEWRFSRFIADRLETGWEADIIEHWLAHMECVRQRVAPGVERPLVFHWSPAETSSMSGLLKSTRARNSLRQRWWVEPNWFDFLNRVMKKEPVIVRGPMGFGLKNVARSLKQHGLIETVWPDGYGVVVCRCRPDAGPMPGRCRPDGQGMCLQRGRLPGDDGGGRILAITGSYAMAIEVRFGAWIRCERRRRRLIQHHVAQHAGSSGHRGS
jgi:hypothetical protein